jgi:hypothetical protein
MNYYTYLIYDGTNHKIGKSVNPEKRLKQIKTGNINAKLICYGKGVSEQYMHNRFFQNRLSGEWFKLNEKQIETAIRLIKFGENSEGNIFDESVSKLINGSKKSFKLSEKYIIDFGKYKGTPINEMLSDEKYDYCVWLYNKMKNEMSIGEKKKSRKYKAFHWVVYKNTNYEIL